MDFGRDPSIAEALENAKTQGTQILCYNRKNGSIQSI